MTYQAVYDAVSANFANAGHLMDCVAHDVITTATEQRRPSVLHRPALTLDGSQWCALYGSNLMEGIAGFGDTPELAMCDFDNQFRTAKVPRSAA